MASGNDIQSGSDIKYATATYASFTKAITWGVVGVAIIVAIVVALIAR